MFIWMDSKIFRCVHLWKTTCTGQLNIISDIQSKGVSLMRPRLMSTFVLQECLLSVCSDFSFSQDCVWIWLFHCPSFFRHSVCFAPILVFQSHCRARSPLKWSQRIWRLCKWNKIIVRPHLPQCLLSATQTKRRSAHFYRSARTFERQFQTSDRVMDEGSEGHQSSAEQN